MNHPHPALQVMRILTLAFLSGPIAFTVVAFFIVPETELPPLWVVAVLLGLVAASVTMVFVLTGTMISSAAKGFSVEGALAQFRALHMASLALLEAPVIVALVLAVGGIAPTWVTVAIAAVPSALAILALAFPHEATLRRVQAQLDTDGTTTRFADRVLGRAG